MSTNTPDAEKTATPEPGVPQATASVRPPRRPSPRRSRPEPRRPANRRRIAPTRRPEVIALMKSQGRDAR